MKWSGQILKELTKTKDISIKKISDEIGISRQTINGWINGQIPKGNHLLSLAKILSVSPNAFFNDEIDTNIIIPVHRARNNAKITEKVQEEAYELAEEYKLFFRTAKTLSILPVIRIDKINERKAEDIAKELKERIEYNEVLPIDFEKTFKLLELLGIYVVFANFPTKVKSYAFFTKIFGNRVVFINNQTNIIDLIFPLLHEAIHAVRDEITAELGYDENEEELCDEIASHIQFSREYINLVYQAIRGLPAATQIIKMKSFAKQYKHSLHGVVKRIKAFDKNFELNVGGADSNLRKQFRTVGEELQLTKTAREFVEALSYLSPHYLKSLVKHQENISDRKLAFLLGIDESLDIIEIRKELMTIKER